MWYPKNDTALQIEIARPDWVAKASTGLHTTDVRLVQIASSFDRLLGEADNNSYSHKVTLEGSRLRCFQGKESPFSQWFRCRFYADGIRFITAEQYMMFHKAMLFHDSETAKKILATEEIAEHKRLGRRVKKYNEEVWVLHRRRVAYEANKHKFSQDLTLLETLLHTAGEILVEASPNDKVWGVGMSAEDPDIADPAKWRGENYLGYVLTMLREDIMLAIEHSPEWEEERVEHIALTEAEYASLKAGFAPDWDFRYEPRYINGWHYFSHTGYWVKKFRFELKSDGMYHLERSYTTKIERGRNILVESFIEGYYDPPIKYLRRTE